VRHREPWSSKAEGGECDGGDGDFNEDGDEPFKEVGESDYNEEGGYYRRTS
jgi:hypothetical protein